MDHEAIAVRRARVDDAAAVSALLGELGYACDDGAAAARVARAEGSEADAILLACRGDRVVGLASVHLVPLFYRDGCLARVTSFVVASSERRRGVGTALIGACERFARERGAERLELTSADRRADAHAFYERAGFARQGVRFTRPVPHPGD